MLNIEWAEILGGACFVALNWKKWTKNDFIFGIILPVIAVFVIVFISKLQSIVGGEPGIVLGLTMEILELGGL